MVTDLEIIKQLELLLNIELEKVSELKWDTRGYLANNGCVVGLSLFYVKLKEFPKIILELKNLNKLYLYGNQLKTLSKEIGELRNLNKLNLRDNQLTAIPKEIGELRNLTGLNLSGNQLTQKHGKAVKDRNPDAGYHVMNRGRRGETIFPL